MATLYEISGITFKGVITLQFSITGLLQVANFEKAELTPIQLQMYFKSLPTSENEFIERANRSGANYKKV